MKKRLYKNKNSKACRFQNQIRKVRPPDKRQARELIKRARANEDNWARFRDDNEFCGFEDKQ